MYLYWLVVYLPLWKIWVSQLGWLIIPNIWKNKNMFQTTNQYSIAIKDSFQGIYKPNLGAPGLARFWSEKNAISYPKLLSWGKGAAISQQKTIEPNSTLYLTRHLRPSAPLYPQPYWWYHIYPWLYMVISIVIPCYILTHGYNHIIPIVITSTQP